MGTTVATKDKSLEIINICREIDRKASSTYQKLAELADSADLRDFWESMAAEESSHRGYWEKLAHLARSGAIKGIFEKPEEVRTELEEANRRIDKLLERSDYISGVQAAFFVAYRLEFYMLHIAFSTLLNLLGVISGETYAESRYESHVEEFIGAIERFGAATPELELIGDVIGRLWKENRQLVFLSNRDPLTEVLNRRGLQAAIAPLAQLAKRRRETVGVLLIDVDNFKSVNDTHGHQAGDKVLAEVACAIVDRVRNSDLVGRYGGDEFIVFLPEVDPGFLEKVAEDIRRRIAVKTINGIAVTASLGASHGVVKGEVEKEIPLLVSMADRRMYRAKRSGKNRVVTAGP